MRGGAYLNYPNFFCDGVTKITERAGAVCYIKGGIPYEKSGNLRRGYCGLAIAFAKGQRRVDAETKGGGQAGARRIYRGKYALGVVARQTISH